MLHFHQRKIVVNDMCCIEDVWMYVCSDNWSIFIIIRLVDIGDEVSTSYASCRHRNIFCFVVYLVMYSLDWNPVSFGIKDEQWIQEQNQDIYEI